TCLFDLRKLGHHIFRNGPAKDVEVLLDPCFVSALREHALTHLKDPAQCHLCRGPLQPAGNGCHDRMFVLLPH
uniref:Uncharacterized protein n=1 Tax=Setaria italica TaxID=4555 RepID=K3ZF34_SETIT